MKRRILSCLVILILSITLSACGTNVEEKVSENISVIVPENEAKEETAEEDLPAFYVEDLNATKLKEDFILEDYYCKNQVTVTNRYRIDENRVLWGYGRNDYGQLGNRKTDSVIFHTEPVKIAENVVSVDSSVNGYFCIYLTEDGKLYGVGSNILGLLGKELEKEEYFSNNDYEKLLTPTLLMEEVAFVSAGRESITALKKDGSVWWWGQYRCTYNTYNHSDSYMLYWQATEDDNNPMKMFYCKPRKILDNCIYATTGDYTGAAISESGDLYTWGLNMFGECGAPVTEDDFLRTPTKVLENVRMVWPEKVAFESTEKEIPDFMRYNTTYDFNVFVKMENGRILAAGEGIGEKEIEVTGDLIEKSTHLYTDSFLPVRLEEYSEERNWEKLNALSWGMEFEEVKNVLEQERLDWLTTFSEEEVWLKVEDNRYILYFDENNRLKEIVLQEGGSRDGRFSMGMSLEEVQEAAGCELVYDKNERKATYWAEEAIGDNCYGFIFYQGKLDIILEMREPRQS